MNNTKPFCLAAFSALVLFANSLSAQAPGGTSGNKGGFAGARQQTSTGRFYGKVVDEKTNKGVPYTPVQLFQNRFDSATKTMKTMLAGGQLTEGNGDFSIENLSPMGKYTLKIAAMGFKQIEMPVSFDIKMPVPGSMPNMAQMAAALDKDLGNIKLSPSAQQLKAIEIDGSAPSYKLEVDKKVYNVDKNPINAGGTAQDVLKNIPSVNVDIDGNVTMRNASPQIFIDGRPTTLTIDQIPADAIENVEIITNPSAKYDAADGGGGIINIVMKKNRKVGYNGSIRAGVDMRGKILSGLDFNVREGKLNFFMNGSFNQRKSLGYGETSRSNKFGSPESMFQTDNSTSNGYFDFGKIGMDYFIDNRNTLTISPMYHQAHFQSGDDIRTDSTYSSGTTGIPYSKSTPITERTNKTYGGSLLYKKLFTKQGQEFTADLNYQNTNFTSSSAYNTQNYNSSDAPTGNPLRQNQDGKGGTVYTTFQSDYVNPINENNKIEGGGRISVRNFSNTLDNFVYSYSQGAFINKHLPNSNYQFTDKIYAGYITYTGKLNKLGYQGGLRAESSDYSGKTTDDGNNFNHKYPISLFPSGFVNYNFNESNTLQLSYTRRISRPSFFQLLPFTDYSNPLSLRRGNPDLSPQFTNALELNYQHLFNRFNSYITSLYFKQTNGLITNFLLYEYDNVLQKSVPISTYENANTAYAYGAELTSRNGLGPFLDLTSNLNLYETKIDGTNLYESITNKQFSWFAKMNLNMRLPKGFSIQLSGDYQSKTTMPVGGGGGFGGFGGGPTVTVQGYIRPKYGMDAALKYDFLKNRAASIILNVSDIFKTKKYDAYNESPFYTQNAFRYRDQQFFRLIFSYRFGKYDVSLFKRKNNKNAEVDDSQGI